ncbi:MAG: tRNA pseudouridine(55) synthase TruB [Bacteroidales bacterium]|nr:tRNA pseudouridine(55) synthase TruB [Bacteroidales bacterium]
MRWTSADLVRKIKFQLQKHFHTHKLKVGHAGTLDPMATGLLIVCVGRATKIAEALQAHEKEYLARIAFGATTASYDLEQPVDQFFPYEHITREAVEAALPQFLGEQEQVPPMYSAKMVNGYRAYEFARAGEEVELRTAHIVISAIELLEYREAGTADGPQAEAVQVSEVVRNVKNFHTATRSEVPGPEALLRIRCSKGTYIRSLARDLGVALNSGAYLTALRRVASGDFRLEDELL